MHPLHSMANFTAIVDEDHERRGHYIREVEPIIAPVPNLQVGRLECGAFCAIWAVGAHAPLSTWQNGTQAGDPWADASARSTFDPDIWTCTGTSIEAATIEVPTERPDRVNVVITRSDDEQSVRWVGAPEMEADGCA